MDDKERPWYSKIASVCIVRCAFGVSRRTQEDKVRKSVGLLHVCSLAAFHSAIGRCNREQVGGEPPRNIRAIYEPLVSSGTGRFRLRLVREAFTTAVS